jgi:hypothetical protein
MNIFFLRPILPQSTSFNNVKAVFQSTFRFSGELSFLARELSSPKEHKIGSTTYRVRRKYALNAKENVMDKLIRLIKNDSYIN